MLQSQLIENIVDKLKDVQGLKAIVLGGSWASDTQRPDSDIDLALYYGQDAPLDIDHIKGIAAQLNDFPNPVVTDLGGWGKWVNGGAWLTIKGQRVDFLYRNIDFVSSMIDACNKGEIENDYYQQPPYGFYSYIYCAETQICKPLYDPGDVIQTLKSKISHYPQPLKHKVINDFTWSASFTLEHARKSAERGEVYIVAGCLTRIASALVQVLYALNETYFMSDKRVYKDVDKFSIKPKDFLERVEGICGDVGCDQSELVATVSATEVLLYEIVGLCGDQYTPRY